MKFDLFYVESPLQFMSAIKAREISTEKSVLVLNLAEAGRESHNSQIRALLKADEWDTVHLFTASKYKYVNTALTLFKTLFLHNKYKGCVNRYFYGEFRSLAMTVLSRSLSPDETILLDDGAYTIAAQLRFIKKGIAAFNADNIEGRILAKLLNIDYHTNHAPHLFSFFDFRGMLVEGQVNYHQPKLKSVPKLDDEAVYYFGSKFSEASILVAEDELAVAKAIKAKYSEKRCFYLPHRDETKQKLATLSAMGFEILSLGKPAEVFFDETDVMPGTLVSCYSTVLYSCYSRFNGIDLVAVDIRHLISNELIRNNASTVYEYYKQLSINVETLD